MQINIWFNIELWSWLVVLFLFSSADPDHKESRLKWSLTKMYKKEPVTWKSALKQKWHMLCDGLQGL